MRILFISCLLWTILFTRQVKGEFILPSVASEFWDKILYYTQTSWKLFSMTHIHIALKVVLPELQQTHFAFVQKRIIDSRIVQILSVIIRRSAISSWLQFNAIWFLNWNCILILSIRWANGKDKAIKMWSRKVTRRKFRCIHWWFLNKALVWISHTGSLPTMSQSRGYVKQSCFYSSNKHIKPCTRRVM